MYVKNQLLEVEITDMTNDGEGVGKIDGYTFFIKDAIIGDRVSFIVTKVKKTYGYGRVKDILIRSSYRIDAPCPQAKRCGGCQIQEMSYDRQLEFKKDKVVNNLIRLGGFKRDHIESILEPIMGMDGEPFRYRNKAQYPIGYDRQGNLICGFYAGRTHAVIPVKDCLLGPAENKDILEAVLTWMKKNGISAYNESSHNGIVRHVLIRKGFTSGEIMVCLVINSDRLPHEKELIEKEAQRDSYEGIENVINVIGKTKQRIKSNVNFELAMELMLLTIKEN